MGEFVCRVADANGRVFSHIEAASSVTEARQKLADRGLYVYAVDQRNRLLSGMLKRRERSVGGSEFLILNQQFNTLIKAGLAHHCAPWICLPTAHRHPGSDQ